MYFNTSELLYNPCIFWTLREGAGARECVQILIFLAPTSRITSLQKNVHNEIVEHWKT